MSLAGIFEALRDLVVAITTYRQWSIAALGLTVVALVALASVDVRRRKHDHEGFHWSAYIYLASTIMVGSMLLLGFAALMSPPAAANPPRPLAVPTPLPTVRPSPTPIVLPIPWTPQPEPTDSPTPTPEPTETSYVEPPPTPTPEVHSALMASTDDPSDSGLRDLRARYLAKPMMAVLADAHEDFAHYREGAGPPFKTWTIFTDFECKVGLAPPNALPQGRMSLQCTSYRAYYPDAAEGEVENLVLDLSSVMKVYLITTEAEFRDWSATQSLRFSTATLYLGSKYFPDGTHIELEVVPSP